MKACILALVVAFIAIQSAEAQRWGWGRGGWGRGWGRGFWGPGFGWGGPFGFGGGFGFGAPVVVPVPVAVPAAAPIGIPPIGLGGVPPIASPFLGKRSVVEPVVVEENNSTEWSVEEGNSTQWNVTGRQVLCHYSSKWERFTCRGAQPLNCSAVANFADLGSFSYRLHGLTLWNASSIVGEQEFQRYRIVSVPLGGVERNNFTLSEPKSQRNITFSVYQSEKCNDIGFRFVEPECWSRFVEIVESVTPESVRLSLFINQ